MFYTENNRSTSAVFISVLQVQVKNEPELPKVLVRASTPLIACNCNTKT